MDDHGLEIQNNVDPFWLEHRQQIDQVREAIVCPNTLVGESRLQICLRNPVFQIYNRIYPIFGSLIALLEYDEIAKRDNSSYFSEPTNQRIMLKSLGLVIEDGIKAPYSSKDTKSFKDYRRFYQGMVKDLHSLDANVEKGIKYPNFVNSLAMIFTHRVNEELEGVDNYDPKIASVRKDVADYLPQLAEIENGKNLETMKKKLNL